jgi:hypothetical protein
MQIFYVLILIITIILIFLIIRYFILGKKNIPGALFSEARRSENSGNFEDALIAYENALREFQKARFPNQGLRENIIQKIKVLQTAIDYQNSHKQG